MMIQNTRSNRHSPSLDLHNQDCMEFMARLPQQSVDLVITSPPYNINLSVNNKHDGYTQSRITRAKYIDDLDALSMSEYFDFLCKVISELLRVSKTIFFNIQMVTGNKPALFEFLGQFSTKIKEVIIWNKGHAQPAIKPNTLSSQFEFIIVFSPENAILRSFDTCNFNRGALSNLWTIPRGNFHVKGHGAIFPYQLPANILENFASTPSTVFDPFMGTGTTAIAAWYYGCDFIGCEVDPHYFNLAKQRIEQETRQGDMLQPHLHNTTELEH